MTSSAIELLSSQRYKYTPLKSRQTRLLRLHPGEPGSDLIATLIHVRIEKNNDPRYSGRRPNCMFEPDTAAKIEFDAISYAWGDPTPFARLYIPRSGFIALTESLYSALQQLRGPEQSDCLWADAICIDQSNNEERSSQVKQMASIFESAERVLVWLGPSQASDTLAFAFIHHSWGASASSSRVPLAVRQRDALQTAAEQLQAHPYCQCCGKWVLTGHDSRKVTADALLALYQLLDRPWFTRLWVLQETQGMPLTHVLSGTHRVSLQSIVDLVTIIEPSQFNREYVLLLSAAEVEQFELRKERAISLAIDYRPHSKEYNRRLWRSLSLLSQRQCQDARDRVYATRKVLSLLHESRLLPNYSISAAEIFQRFTLVSFGKRPLIIDDGHDYSGLYENSEWLTEQRKIPTMLSWVALSIANTTAHHSGLPDSTLDPATLSSWAVDLSRFTDLTRRKITICLERPSDHTQFGTDHNNSFHTKTASSAWSVLLISGRCFAKVHELSFTGELGLSGANQTLLERTLRWFEWYSTACVSALHRSDSVPFSRVTELLYSDEPDGPPTSHARGVNFGHVGPDVIWNEDERGPFKQRLRQICEEHIDRTDQDRFDAHLETLATFLLRKAPLWLQDDNQVVSDTNRVLRLIDVDGRMDFGWVPRSAQPGDDICVINGAPYPYVLRRVDDEQYTLLGDACSVNTSLEEALGGGYRGHDQKTVRKPKLIVDDSGRYRVIYEDIRTSRVVWDSPCVRPLLRNTSWITLV